MAVSQQPVIVSFISETTLSTGSQYKIAWAGGSGMVTIGDPGSTSVAAKPVGVYYGDGMRSTSTESEAVPVAIGGIVKLRMAASTRVAGQVIAASSNGLGCTPTTNMWVVGRQLSGSSGAINRIVDVLWFPSALLYSARMDGTT